MKFCILASGSDGNCIYVESQNTRILIDAGITRKRIKEKLAEIGVALESINGVCITHDHSDHTSGIPVLFKQHSVSLYATEATRANVEYSLKKQFEWNIFESGNTFAIGELSLHPFPVPHDAGDPVGFVITDGKSRIGIATDMGEAPEVVAQNLKGCHALILEFTSIP